ncbi:MAG: ABC transporter permease [Spirochaetaceae bacterium]|nr:MAG: ABC transporter permease [Spirochaetaceae bacterium]
MKARSSHIVPIVIGLCLVFGSFIFSVGFREMVLRALFPATRELIYLRTGLPHMLGEHLSLVLLSSVLASIAGFSLGVFVTRPYGREFLPLVRGLSSFAQTFPPVAILALAFPVLGFGFRPTVAALFAFGILPVLNNTIEGIESVDASLIEAAQGQGMTPGQVLLQTELPLAAQVIVAGIRTSVIINIGTATIGATIGAGGLGTVIIAGLVRNNTAFVFTGAITAAGIALATDWLFSRLELVFFNPQDGVRSGHDSTRHSS